MCMLSCIIMLTIDLLNAEFNIKHCIFLGIGVIPGNDSLYSVANWSSSLWFCYALFIIKLMLSSIQQVRNKKVAGGGFY